MRYRLPTFYLDGYIALRARSTYISPSLISLRGCRFRLHSRLRDVSSQRSCRRSASGTSVNDSSLETPTHNSATRPAQATAASSPKSDRQKIGRQTQLLDAYLPLELRSRDWLNNLATYEGVRPIHTLPDLLLEAYSEERYNLLSYIGVEQGRWAALMWLIDASLGCQRLEVHTLDDQSSFPFPLRDRGQLDDLTLGPIEINVETPSPHILNLDRLTELSEQSESSEPGLTPAALRTIVGEVWQCAGHIIIAATERSADECRVLTSHLEQILALMHHRDVMPLQVYELREFDELSTLQKPPMLGTMQPRILEALADAAWLAHERQRDGKEILIGTRYRSRGDSVSLGVWMDLVLWSCVEQGFITAAAQIVRWMPQSPPALQWSVVDWKTIESTCSDLRNRDRLKAPYFRHRSWFESFSQDAPFIDTGPRTVSREVIVAIIDGLIYTVGNHEVLGIEENNLPISSILDIIHRCKSLLDRQESLIGLSFWMSIMIRLIESSRLLPGSNLNVIPYILDLVPYQQISAEPSACSIDTGFQEPVSVYGALKGVLHQTMDCHIYADDLPGTLRTFQRLRNLVDHHRQQLHRASTHGTTEDVDAYVDDTSRSDTWQGRNDAAAHLQIPDSSMAALLDMITAAKMFDFGSRLIWAEDVDGPIIPLSSHKSEALQPALLRFAAAAEDTGLLVSIINIIEAQESPLTNDVLGALFTCQVTLGKWSTARALLEFMRDDRRIHLDPSAVMAVAQTLMKHEATIPATPDSAYHMTQAEMLLRDILGGSFQIPPAPGQRQNFEQSRQLHQISRILSALPGEVGAIAQPFTIPTFQRHATTPIPVKAFHILLDALVDIRGSLVGRSFFEQWCRMPGSADDQHVHSTVDATADDQYVRATVAADENLPIVEPDPSGLEKVVAATPWTIRIILEPILQRIRAPHHTSPKGEQQRTETDSENQSQCIADEAEELDPTPPDLSADQVSLLRWGQSMYRELGLREQDIELAIPTSVVGDALDGGASSDPVREDE